MKTNILFILFVLIIACSSRTENKAQVNLTTRDVATHLYVVWELVWGPDNFIWCTERNGRISRVNPESGEIIPLITISDVIEGGERGLLGMVLHPDFANNPYVFVAYNYQDNDQTLVKVVRFTYNGTALSSPLILLSGINGNIIHDGARLLIDENLKLFVTTGETGNGPLAQDLHSLNGKILRMNLDGSIPSDNPIPNSYLWTWGHRNPQGLVKANGILYSSEHGPDSDDEVNIIYKGRNYGWPYVLGYCNTPDEKKFCQDSNVVEPIADWTPTLAVSGLKYYDNDKIPQWKNSLLLCTLKGSMLVQLQLSEDHTKVVKETHFFEGQFGRLRGICVSPDGRVFISTSNRDGRGNPAAQDDRIIEIKEATNVPDNNQNGVNIIGYPNPSNGNIEFRTTGLFSNESDFKIIDIFGRTVRHFNSQTFNDISDTLNWDGCRDDGTKCSAGYFTALLRSGNKTYSWNFIIQK